MAKRRFTLPTRLNKQQFEARDLPLSGQHLIIGGPGTGKSVLALLRARRLAAEKIHYCFLVFNHSLRQSNEQLFDGTLASQQWQAWFLHLYTTHVSSRMPRLPKSQDDHYAAFDWHKILANIQDCSDDTLAAIDKPFLIIDEGQDMPPLFYASLVNLGFENFFVVADQNQQIVDGENSSRQDIENALGLDTHEVVKLEENHRNNFGIAVLAQQFYQNDPASPPPKLPKMPTFNGARPLLFSYKQSQFNALVERMLIMATNAPTALIGVICPNNVVRLKYLSALKTLVKAKQQPLRISTFFSGNSNNLAFEEGGVMVLNAQACKGLEFDTVFLADIDQYQRDDTHRDTTQKLFYVMTSRAIERIFLLTQTEQINRVEAILPADDTILERRP